MYSFIEFFDCGSLPDLLSLFFKLGVTFPLVALDEIQWLERKAKYSSSF